MSLWSMHALIQRVAIISKDVYDWIPAQSIFKINSLWKMIYTKSLMINRDQMSKLNIDSREHLEEVNPDAFLMLRD